MRWSKFDWFIWSSFDNDARIERLTPEHIGLFDEIRNLLVQLLKLDLSFRPWQAFTRPRHSVNPRTERLQDLRTEKPTHHVIHGARARHSIQSLANAKNRDMLTHILVTVDPSRMLKAVKGDLHCFAELTLTRGDPFTNQGFYFLSGRRCRRHIFALLLEGFYFSAQLLDLVSETGDGSSQHLKIKECHCLNFQD